MTNRAALYLRSSKDRSDVSIDAQRRGLQELAASKGLVVVEEFADAVESGKDEDRPGFQALIRLLKAPGRPWEHILVLDTSRVARRRHIAQIFEHECDRARVRLHFKNVPDTDPITGMLLKALLQAMDEWHSLTSKAKGLAGMAENVRQGFRAGGAAPIGYQLAYQGTGAVRDGAPVLKSKLAPSDDAHQVAAYLRARAGGQSRGRVVKDLGITWPASSLNSLEWNALTYAGHTTWNTTYEFTPAGHVGGTKRKPRADWLITRDTHPAMITDTEAEQILVELETKRWTRTRDTDHAYLLTGILKTADGRPWTGEWDSKMGAGLYRCGKGKRISCRRVDIAVLDQLRHDLSGDEAVRQVLASMQQLVAEPIDGRTLAGLEKKIEGLTRKVASLVDLITEAKEHERAAYRRTIEAHESERAGLIEELGRKRGLANQAQAASRYTENDARRLLRVMFDSLQATVAADEIETTKAALGGLVEKVVLEESGDQCQINYRIGAALPSDTGFILATLRGGETTPVRWQSTARIVAKADTPSRRAA